MSEYSDGNDSSSSSHFSRYAEARLRHKGFFGNNGGMFVSISHFSSLGPAAVCAILSWYACLRSLSERPVERLSVFFLSFSLLRLKSPLIFFCIARGIAAVISLFLIYAPHAARGCLTRLCP